MQNAPHFLKLSYVQTAPYVSYAFHAAQSALYSCASEGDAGPVGSVSGCTSANLPAGYIADEVKELSKAKMQHVQ